MALLRVHSILSTVDKDIKQDWLQRLKLIFLLSQQFLHGFEAEAFRERLLIAYPSTITLPKMIKETKEKKMTLVSLSFIKGSCTYLSIPNYLQVDCSIWGVIYM